MKKTIEVVDDFHPDPHTIRRTALAAGRRPAGPADGALGRTWVAEAPLDEDTAGRLRRLLTDRRSPAPRVSRTFFTEAGPAAPGPEPTRLDTGGWAALVWLSPPDECGGGLAFHRARSGTEPAGPGPDAWEETMFVPARFNRLVLFDSATAFTCGPVSEPGPLAQVILADCPPTD